VYPVPLLSGAHYKITEIMAGFLICSSMRNRPYWTSLASALLNGKSAAWKGIIATCGTSRLWALIEGGGLETTLNNHDAALPLLQASGANRRVLRIIFLTMEDVGVEDARNRIERLYHLNGGRDVAIVMLMEVGQNKGSAMATLMRLQIE
jgi:hypothetical protein